MPDQETLTVYATRAQDYAQRFGKAGDGPHMKAFLAEVPKGGRILDLGCGPGHAAASMKRAGFVVDALDASPELASIAREQHGIEVRIASFEALDDDALYDGIYANFSLLHAPKTDMPGHLARIARALKPNGVFHIGLKSGSGERRDSLGRFYAYYEAEELTRLLSNAGLDVFSQSEGEEVGLDGAPAPWIILMARAHD